LRDWKWDEVMGINTTYCKISSGVPRPNAKGVFYNILVPHFWIEAVMLINEQEHADAKKQNKLNKHAADVAFTLDD
jgi:hypothetical protein